MFGPVFQRYFALLWLSIGLMACAPIRYSSSELATTNSVTTYTSQNCRAMNSTERQLRLFRGPDVFGMIAVNPRTGEVTESYTFDHTKFIIWQDQVPKFSTDLSTVLSSLVELFAHHQQWGSPESVALLEEHIRIVPDHVMGSFFSQITMGPNFDDGSWSLGGHIVMATFDENKPLILPTKPDQMTWRNLAFVLKSSELITSENFEDAALRSAEWRDGAQVATLTCDKPEPIEVDTIEEKVRKTLDPGVHRDMGLEMAAKFFPMYYAQMAAKLNTDAAYRAYAESQFIAPCMSFAATMRESADLRESLALVTEDQLVGQLLVPGTVRSIYESLAAVHEARDVPDIDDHIRAAVRSMCVQPIFKVLGR